MSDPRSEVWTFGDGEGAGSASSSVIDKLRLDLVGVAYPDSVVGTSITFNVSTGPNGTMKALYYDNAVFTLALVADGFQSFPYHVFRGCREIQIVSNDTEADGTVILPVFREPC